jgi:hypothetical protein
VGAHREQGEAHVFAEASPEVREEGIHRVIE